MRRIIYVHELPDWPSFRWPGRELPVLSSEVRHQQGRLLGKMQLLGFNLRKESSLQALTQSIIKSGEIEGEKIQDDAVRSSAARRLGIKTAGLVPAGRYIDGIVEMMLDATGAYDKPLTFSRLFGWHNTLFPSGRSGMHKIRSGAWRNNPESQPMRVVSGTMGREKVHFIAPASKRIAAECSAFVKWFNFSYTADPLIKAAVAHFWFVTLHPFDDGNGRIARALTDMLLARADESAERFYSMSAQIMNERKAYYQVLEECQKGNLDISAWLFWFLKCLSKAMTASDTLLAVIHFKANFWQKYFQSGLNERQIKILNSMLEGFEGKLTSSKYAALCRCSQDSAIRDIQQLVKLRILKQEAAGGRSTSYILRK